jgi:hypothetical protein
VRSYSPPETLYKNTVITRKRRESARPETPLALDGRGQSGTPNALKSWTYSKKHIATRGLKKMHLTLLQMLGPIGAAGLIAAIMLNLLV